MFDFPFDFFALVIAIVAFIFARKAFNQVAVLRARLERSEHRRRPPPHRCLRRSRRYGVEQPLPPASPGIASEPPPIVPDVESIAASIERAIRWWPRDTAASAPATRSRLRGTPRHPLGGLGRRSDAGARRLLHGPLFDRGRADLRRRAHRCSAACSRWRCWPRANGPAARRASPRSKRCRSPIFPPSSPPPEPRSRSRRSMPPTRCTIFWCPPPPSSCSAWWRWARWPRRCCTARRWPDSASPAPSSRRSWSLPTSRTSGRSTSISPSSPRRHSGWRASGCGAGSRSPPSCSRCCGRSPACNAARRWSAPHAFHVIAGFILAALLVVCGFMFGPAAEDGQIEPISSGSLAAYLLGATLIVLNSFHADTAMIVFALLVAGTLFVAWRAMPLLGAVGAAAALRLHRVCRMGGARQPGMLVLPGGPLPGIGPAATDGSVSLHLISGRRSSRPVSASPDFWRRAAPARPSSR